MSDVRTTGLDTLFDPATRPDPYPVLHELRRTSPRPALDGAMIVVGDYQQCDRVLRDLLVSSDRTRSRMASGPPPRRPSFLMLDPPDHTRLRRLVSTAFTPRVVAGLEPRIQAVLDELLGAAAGKDSLEVVGDLAYPLPVRIISELLGVPADDQDRFREWSRRLARTLEPPVAASRPDDEAAAEDARAEFNDYFRSLIERRRRRPGVDLLSRLIAVEEQGEQLDEDELLATCVLLLVAGHETTANLIANGVLALLRHPDQLAALRGEPALVGSAVEEVLRYDPPVQLTTRVARGPLRVGSLDVEPDTLVLLLLAAANRDPAQFREPDRFDITRAAPHHLAFAAGPHFCLGASLARLEARLALRAIAERVDAPVLDEASLSYRPHVNLRGPERLVVSHAGIR